MDYKPTLNLPKTVFPMKGNLPATEPKVLARWEEERLHEKLLEARKGAEPFILHDGPPYANGDIHMGHALNKVLKDIIVRFWTLRGRWAPYVPGWDCHGLPIEHALMKELKVTKHQVKVGEFRKQAREYALKYVGIQRDQFKRLGLLGDWDHPYLTLDPGYVAAELRFLAKLVSEGYVYRARKPVNWCWSCETALAEAEVEYEQHTSPSVFVKFKLDPKCAKRFLPQGSRISRVYLVIWTTTPWTLMGNVAVAIHPNFCYVLREGPVPDEGWITLERLPPKIAQLIRITGSEHPVLSRFFGISSGLAGMRYWHPFLSREGQVVLADYVSSEEGTGLVHTAPGFGAEDYLTGKKYNLEIVAPVDSKGQFTGLPEEVAQFNGQQVQKTNTAVVELLNKTGNLVRTGTLEHQVPHCWRCHEPTIFRATDQWFLNVEHERLRERLLQAIEKEVRWIPPVGKERMAGMLKSRPDWCLSRQRLWGVPIPALICRKCKGGWLVPEVIENFARAVESAPDAVDRWFTDAYKEWIPQGFQCLDCGGEEFVQGTDILDVWFDSGVSHEAVLRQRKELTHPADMYLEGSDQHRGWFQVSLITGTALEGKAPYRSVLTHGFVVDGEGRKMSKSLGNVMAPAQVISQFGADVLRLWVASSDYAEDVRLSPTILAQVSESYRKIRNTIRFCLANINLSQSGLFSMCRDGRLPTEKFQYWNFWALAQLADLERAVIDAYEQYAFHRVVKAVHEFCAVSLSNVYLDIIKDQLYASHPSGEKRGEIQTVLAIIVYRLTLFIAPILPMTAEEIWESFPVARGEGSVHLQIWPTPLELHVDESTRRDWEKLLALRGEAMKALEKARESGLIGDALEAELEIGVWDVKLWSFLEARREDFREACILSGLKLVRGVDGGAEADPSFTVRKAPGAKCQRCWMRLESVGRSPEHPGLCHRCVEVVHRLTRLG